MSFGIVLIAMLERIDRCKKCPQGRMGAKELIDSGNEFDISGRCDFCAEVFRSLARVLNKKITGELF